MPADCAAGVKSILMRSYSEFNMSGVGKNSCAGPIRTLGDDTKNTDPYTNRPLPQLLITLLATMPLSVTDTSTNLV